MADCNEIAIQVNFAPFICDLFLSAEQSVDILINNAAVGGIPYTKTEDGYEMTLAVNHLGTC